MTEIEERAQRAYVGIRETVTMDGLPGVIDRGFPELFGWLGARGLAIAGPPFVRYLRIDTEMEVDLGVPAEGAADGDERVRAQALPAGRWVVAMHVGHFSGLRAAHGALQEQMREQGLAWSEFCEHYVTDPREEPDSSRWRTELAYLIA